MISSVSGFKISLAVLACAFGVPFLFVLWICFLTEKLVTCDCLPAIVMVAFLFFWFVGIVIAFPRFSYYAGPAAKSDDDADADDDDADAEDDDADDDDEDDDDDDDGDDDDDADDADDDVDDDDDADADAADDDDDAPTLHLLGLLARCWASAP